MSKSLLQVVVITFITMLVWVGYSIYSTTKQTGTVDVDGKYLQPISSSFDHKALKHIVDREGYVLVPNQALGLGGTPMPTVVPNP